MFWELLPYVHIHKIDVEKSKAVIVINKIEYKKDEFYVIEYDIEIKSMMGYVRMNWWRPDGSGFVAKRFTSTGRHTGRVSYDMPCRSVSFSNCVEEYSCYKICEIPTSDMPVENKKYERDIPGECLIYDVEVISLGDWAFVGLNWLDSPYHGVWVASMGIERRSGKKCLTGFETYGVELTLAYGSWKLFKRDELPVVDKYVGTPPPPPGAPNIKIVNFDCPDEVDEGKNFQILVTLKNDGGERGEFRLEWNVNGQFKYVSGGLPAGKSIDLKADFVMPSHDVKAKVTLKNGEGKVLEEKEKLIKIRLLEAKGQIVDFKIPSEAKSGSRVIVEAVVKNVGQKNAGFRVKWSANGYSATTTVVYLVPGDSYPFPWSFIMPGRDVTVKAVLERKTDGEFVRDDEKTGKIKVVIPPAKGKIVEWIKPSSAREGETVNWTVKVKNVGESQAYFCVKHYASGVKHESSVAKILKPGEIGSFNFSFKMPNRDVACRVECLRKINDKWVLDDYKENTITVGVPPTEMPMWQKALIAGSVAVGLVGGGAYVLSRGEKR